ncbi:MAG: putative superfamily drug exporter [Planctomycetota bacterium]|nr:putative superfamily drug exporter [Planctomycetota bacterium]
MFELLGRLVNRWGAFIVLAWLVVATIFWYFAPDWHSVTKDDDVSFFPPNYPSVVGQALLSRGFPDDVASSSAVIVAERRGGPLQAADLAHVDRVAKAMEDLSRTEKTLGIRKVLHRNLRGIGSRMVSRPSPQGQAALVVVALRGTYVSREARLAVDRIDAELKNLPPPPEGLRVGMTGSAAVGNDTNRASTRSVKDTTNATIALVIVILLVVYRSPLLALIPMATIALSVAVSLWSIALLTKVPGLNFQVINITDVFVVVVLFGAGTDYCLFLIARYREELARGRGGEEALSEAIRQVGGAVVASAGTVILGLGMLWFSTFAKIQYTGPAIALSLVVALVGSLTLAPVMLHWLRGLVFWPFKPPHHTAGRDPEAESQEETPLFGFWSKVSDRVVRHPVLILAVSIVTLTPFAIVGARTQSSYDLLGDLGPEQPSIIGAEMFKRYFAVGDLGPSTILIRHPQLDFRSVAGQKAVEQLATLILKVPNVNEVRAVSRPVGVPIPLEGLLRQFLLRADSKIEPEIFGNYVSVKAKDPADRNHITRVDVVFKTSPFAATSLESLDRVRSVVTTAIGKGGPLEGVAPGDVGYTGTTVLIHDLRSVTTEDERRMYILVTSGVYLILVLLLRRPWICLYLIATVILGYLASLGITELVFKSLHKGPEPWSGLDWKVGFFLFVILVAVGEDYNIFLMARVIEEERKHGAVEGTRRAVAHTGGIISSCGVIMAGTFGSMLFGSLTTLKELGFALGLGVLLDTFVVRPILVPAFVVLIHRPRGRLRLPAGGPLESPIVPDEAGARAESA